MTIFPLPVIAEHSSSTVMEEYLRNIILSKVSSFPITAGDSGLVTGQGDDSEINLRNGLRIVQDNARVFRCPEVHSEMNEEDDDSTKQQHRQQRKPTSNKCRWGSESPTKLSPIISRRNSVTNDGDQLPLSVRRKMLSRKGLRSPPPPPSAMSSSLCRWTSTDLQDLRRRYLIPMAGEKVTVQAAVEKAISVSSSSAHSYSDPYQRQRADSSDKLMRRPERRVSVEGFEKLLCYQEEDQQGDEKLISQNVRWHSY